MSWKGIVYGIAKFFILIIVVFSVANYYEFKLHPTFGDGGVAIKDDVSLLTFGPYVSETYSDSTGEKHESGVGWVFMILMISILNQNDGEASVYVSYLEDESGLKHDPYIIEDQDRGRDNLERYSSWQPIELDDKGSQYITVVYRVPTNTDPSIFHYKITTPHNYFARDMIYFNKNILDYLV